MVTNTMRLGKKQCHGCGNLWKNKRVTTKGKRKNTKITCYVCGKLQTGSRASLWR